MHWRSLKDRQPVVGSECIVKHKVSNAYHYGIYQYMTNQWHSDIRTICTSNYDYWCYVDDVIDYVGARLKDELMFAIRQLKDL